MREKTQKRVGIVIARDIYGRIVPNSKKPTGTRTANREMTDGSGRTRSLDSNPKP